MTTKTKLVKTFEEACEKLGLNPEHLPDFSMMPEKHRNALTAHAKLVIIAEALNDGWQPDWSNDDEYKYWPYFEITEDKNDPSGFGFSYTDYDYWDSSSDVGSRLCYSSRELSKYAGETFVDLYREYFLIK